MPSEPAAVATPFADGPLRLPDDALVRPAWPAPPNVHALMTTRAGGVSAGALASLNLGRRVGDHPEALAENHRRFAASLRAPGPCAPARPVWLTQVHGTRVLALDRQTPAHPETPADAAWTCSPDIACVVGAADCLPVLFCTRDGRAVAAAHAGWRGLAAGVLEAAVDALTRGADAQPDELLAWLGPCIGAASFEVGAEVLVAFGRDPVPVDAAHFAYCPRPDGAPRWRADLKALAHEQLTRLGLRDVSVDPACTYEQSGRFFSFRRDPHAGRMAAAIWRC